MIRRGRWKYVHCDIDPPMLFDMDADPDELQNLAADPSYAELEAAFASEVRERWDSAQIRADVLASQRMRRGARRNVGRPAGRLGLSAEARCLRGVCPQPHGLDRGGGDHPVPADRRRVWPELTAASERGV